jgi:uncharacterized tellurite resistance protein B-like protein
MATEKSTAIRSLKTVVHAKGGEPILASAKAAVAVSSSPIPSTSNADEVAFGRHALATFDAAFLMAAADGVLSDAELDELAELLAELTDHNATDDDLGRLLDTFANALEQLGMDERLASLAEALDTPDSRRIAFVVACGLSFLDGNVHEAEEALFAKLADALAIPQDEATQLLDEIERTISAA